MIDGVGANLLRGMYAAVPSTIPGDVSPKAVSAVVPASAGAVGFAMPKSRTFTRPRGT